MSKLLSARWLLAVVTTFTVCLCVGLNIEVPNHFYTVWGIIAAHYFSRTDRVQSTNGKEGNGSKGV